MQVSVNSATTYLTRLFITTRSDDLDQPKSFGTGCQRVLVSWATAVPQRLTVKPLFAPYSPTAKAKHSLCGFMLLCAGTRRLEPRQRCTTDGSNCFASALAPHADAQSSNAQNVPQRKATINPDRDRERKYSPQPCGWHRGCRPGREFKTNEVFSCRKKDGAFS